MPYKISEKRRRLCWKKPYTKVEAQTVVNQRMQNGRGLKGKKLRIYHCNLCNFWHPTHKPDYKEDWKD